MESSISRLGKSILTKQGNKIVPDQTAPLESLIREDFVLYI